MHQVIATMLWTAELDMANKVETSDKDMFLTDAAWVICSTYHTMLKAFSVATIFGRDMLFDPLFLADWNNIGEHRQYQTDLSIKRKNSSRCD